MNTAPILDSNLSTLERVQRHENLARLVLKKIRQRSISEPRSGPSFTIAQAAALVGRTPSAIRVAETDGRLPEQSRNSVGRRENYSLKQLNDMRDLFNTRPWRNPADKPVILPVQNFKGGVAKTTVSVHLAQYLAIHGYRVLLIDADAQASATMLFGYIPDDDLGPNDSIYACLNPGDINYRPITELIQKTHYDGLDLIPANLNLYNAEYELAARMPKLGSAVLSMLSKQIQTVAHNYDVIVMDPPPALGMISLSVLYAANGILIPMPPNVLDFASTTAFLSMLSQNMQQLQEVNLTVEYDFIQMVISRSDESKQAQREIVSLATGVFGREVMTTELKNSAEIDNATARHQSVYDLTTSATNHHVRKRCLDQLNALNAEVEQLIRAQWKHTPPLEQ